MSKLLHQEKDFPSLINAAFVQSGIPEAFIIKDYWVTEILRAIQSSSLNGKVIFKGGTSLSKALGIINRFSEDIDLLFTSENASKKQRRKLMKQAEDLALKISDIELDADNSDNFSSDDHRTTCLKYQAADKSGILPYIKLEMGFRGGIEPHKTFQIESIIGKLIREKNPASMQKISNLSPFEVMVLDPFRTMIEKIFSLHRAFHDGRLQDKERHFYDIYHLLKIPTIQNRLGSDDHMNIKKDVAHYDIQFNNVHIPTDLSFSESPIFKNDHDQYKAVKTAYGRSQIYFGDRPSFDEIIKFISQFTSKF